MLRSRRKASEVAILKHPAVMQAAVIGIPIEEWGEAVHAVVVLNEGATSWVMP